MNITILPGAALDDAKVIDNIVAEILEDLQTLNKAIIDTIPEGIETTWSNTVRENWERYFSTDIPEALDAMKLSAANLRLAVEQALQYDQEQ